MYNRPSEVRIPQLPDTVGCNSVLTLQDDIKDKWFLPSDRDRCSRRLFQETQRNFYRELGEGCWGKE